MQEIKVRDIIIGEGIPKICVPIVAANIDEAVVAAKEIAGMNVDIVEYRADYFKEWKDHSKLRKTLESIRNVIGNKVLLFTFRTSAEGGNGNASVKEYLSLCKMVCDDRLADVIDVEAFIDEETYADAVSVAHSNGVIVVASNHDFDGTPDEDEMLRRLKYMESKDADIVKLAVMPNSARDVILLLSVTERYNRIGRKPLITMSMGGKGIISRLSGEVFGSVVTFAQAGRASAPGQIPVDDLRKILESIHNSK